MLRRSDTGEGSRDLRRARGAPGRRGGRSPPTRCRPTPARRPVDRARPAPARARGVPAVDGRDPCGDRRRSARRRPTRPSPTSGRRRSTRATDPRQVPPAPGRRRRDQDCSSSGGATTTRWSRTRATAALRARDLGGRAPPADGRHAHGRPSSSSSGSSEAGDLEPPGVDRRWSRRCTRRRVPRAAADRRRRSRRRPARPARRRPPEDPRVRQDADDRVGGRRPARRSAATAAASARSSGRWVAVVGGLIAAVAGFVAFVATPALGRVPARGRAAPAETVAPARARLRPHVRARARRTRCVMTHYGRSVITAGFMLYFGSPAFFVDASDGLMLDRGQRIMQSFAGPFAELVLAGARVARALRVPRRRLAPTSCTSSRS